MKSILKRICNAHAHIMSLGCDSDETTVFRQENRCTLLRSANIMLFSAKIKTPASWNKKRTEKYVRRVPLGKSSRTTDLEPLPIS